MAQEAEAVLANVGLRIWIHFSQLLTTWIQVVGLISHLTVAFGHLWRTVLWASASCLCGHDNLSVFSFSF